MARLIDADALKKELIELGKKKGNQGLEFLAVHSALCALNDVLKLIDAQPSIDSAKHGHWILIYEVPSGSYFKCSECNHEVFLKSGRKVSDDYRYCSGCGAKMDGKAE